MLLRFQCSKSTDNPKIYVSSAARHQLWNIAETGFHPTLAGARTSAQHVNNIAIGLDQVLATYRVFEKFHRATRLSISRVAATFIISSHVCTRYS